MGIYVGIMGVYVGGRAYVWLIIQVSVGHMYVFTGLKSIFTGG